MRRPRLPLRPIALLAAFCLAAGVVAAGAVFPVVGGIGRGVMAVSDGVNSVSTDLVDGPLPQASTVTDKDGNPIARFFDPNQNRQVSRRCDPRSGNTPAPVSRHAESRTSRAVPLP